MRFWMTPGQRRILKAYWSSHRPFSAQDLLEQGISRSLSAALSDLRGMERKSQVYPLRRAGENTVYVGTTEDPAQWKDLKRQNRPHLFEPFINEDPFRGMNPYEAQETADTFIAIINEKKAEILRRKSENDAKK